MKGTNTLMKPQTPYTKEELKEIKEIIISKIERAEEDLRILNSSFRNDSDNGTRDTYSTFKEDDVFEENSKQANAQLAMRQEKFIRDLRNALLRMENGSFGICRVTKKLIRVPRLKLVPHATLSIEAKREIDNEK